MTNQVLNILVLLLGLIIGYGVRTLYFYLKKNSVEKNIDKKIAQARNRAIEIIESAQTKADKTNDFIKEKELHIFNKEKEIDIKNSKLENLIKEKELIVKNIFEKEKEIKEIHKQKISTLESISGISQEEALDLLLQKIENDNQENFLKRLSKLNKISSEEIEDRARSILSTVIQKISVDVTNDLTTSYITINDPEIKSKIIGKEGRNIKSFENSSGVNILVDEYPDKMVLSSFDSTRRAIAKIALERLIEDGRINPSKIEDELEKAKKDIHEKIREAGASAISECKIYNLDPHLVTLLGKLNFRSSYGQNVLAHSIECAHIANSLALELGANNEVAKTAALLHDIGKAIDQEIEGGHVDLGIKLLRRFGVNEDIVNAMKSHHDDYPHESIESVIVQTADMISASRKGARNNSKENHIQRLDELEDLVHNFNGVQNVYAINSGREIRVFVHPEMISDLKAHELAKEIAISIEDELAYPGQIKITIIRETRVINYAR